MKGLRTSKGIDGLPQSERYSDKHYGCRMKQGILFITVLSLMMWFRGFGTCGELPTGKEELRAMVLNAWSGLDYIGTIQMGEYETPDVREARFRALVKEIRALSPDIIGINEANFLPDYIKKLAGAIDYDYIYHVGVSGLHIFRIGIPWNLKEGDAILARKDLNLKYVGRKQLSEGGFAWNNLSFHLDDLTQVLIGRIKIDEKIIYIAVTHWHASPANNSLNRKRLQDMRDKWGYSNGDYKIALKKLEAGHAWRMGESRRMISFLDEKTPGETPLIVMGDFNAEMESPEMQLLFKAGFHDTFSERPTGKGNTWDAEKNLNIKKYYHYDPGKKYDDLFSRFKEQTGLENSRIDFILRNSVIPQESVVKSTVCADRIIDGVHPSDHFGVLTVFKLNK